MAARADSPPAATPRAAALVGAAFALAVLGPGLGDVGIWGEAELPVLDRALARLGLASGTFERAPILADLTLGAWTAALQDPVGLEVAARSLGLVGVALLCALACVTAATNGARWGRIVLCAGVFVSLPLASFSASTVLGDPLGEAAIFGASALLAGALGGRGRRRAVGLAAAVPLLGLAVHLRGLGWGAALPLLAAGLGTRPPSRLRTVALAGGTGALAATVLLAVRQGDGYLPILAAAKAQAFLDNPSDLSVAGGFGAFVRQTWPWAPLALLAAVAVGEIPRWVRAYLALAVAAAGPWCLAYGTVPLPVLAATAVATAGAAEALASGRVRNGRLWLVLLAAAWVAVAKDARAYPAAYTNLLGPALSGTFFPAEALDLGGRLARATRLLLLLALACGVLLLRGRLRPSRALALWGVLVLAAVVPHGIVRPPIARLSLAPLLATHRDAVAAGALPPALLSLRVDVPEIGRYAEGVPIEKVRHRRALARVFETGEPAAALVRKTDLPGLFQLHRKQGWPLHVLDDRHAWVRLVSNVLPPGLEDRNPLRRIVLDEPVDLAHRTYVRFEDAVEILGWEIDGPVVRGSHPKVRVLLRVVGPVPASAKLVFRLQAGRTSRIGAEPVELTGGLYPPGYFRPGDVILHEHRLSVPVLEVLTGPHRVVVGLKRNEKRNLRITEPSGREGDFGVRIVDRAHHFAAVGTAMVY